MEFHSDKSSLRKIFKTKRSALLDEEVIKKSQAINSNFINNLLPKISHKNKELIFSIYFPCDNEVAVGNIVEHFRKNKILFSYPKIIAKNQPLKFFLTQEKPQFIASRLYPKIMELDSKTEILPNILILPLLAFDKENHRIGSGGGFFDRTIAFFKDQKLEITTIALAYDFQGPVACFTHEKTDQKLDFIVSEKHIFSLESIDS